MSTKIVDFAAQPCYNKFPRLHKESPEWVKLRRNARRLREELMVERVGPPDNRPVLEAVIFIYVCLQTNLLNFGIDRR